MLVVVVTPWGPSRCTVAKWLYERVALLVQQIMLRMCVKECGTNLFFVYIIYNLIVVFIAFSLVIIRYFIQKIFSAVYIFRVTGGFKSIKTRGLVWIGFKTTCFTAKFSWENLYFHISCLRWCSCLLLFNVLSKKLLLIWRSKHCRRRTARLEFDVYSTLMWEELYSVSPLMLHGTSVLWSHPKDPCRFHYLL